MTLLLVTYDHPALTTQVYGDAQPLDIFDSGGEDGGIGGIDDVNPRTFDAERQFADGDVKGPHYAAPTVITIPLCTAENITPAAALVLLAALQAAWMPLESPTDYVTLTVNRWADEREFQGAPIGLKTKTGLLRSGYFSAFATFKVYDETTGS